MKMQKPGNPVSQHTSIMEQLQALQYTKGVGRNSELLLEACCRIAHLPMLALLVTGKL